MSGFDRIYEAEDLTLTNYLTELNGISSGGEHISLLGSGATSGTATGTFSGQTGIYEVNIVYYDENDGESSGRVTVAGDSDIFLWDGENKPPGPSTVTERITHSAIFIETGDTFEIAA
ncbi:MAG: hypothetical protein MJK14_26790 [Rivularia sp. ALOHA_DT_140]|nr:hypothetical protein [Rivularia sp. ALOHA_DT_140]